MLGTLYLVATPIGNLQDITLRALETLRTVDVIACEDTRHTRNLLNHFRITNRVVSYHEHNEHERSEEFIGRLIGGESIAIVSDAGTPGICDPGFRVVQRAAEAGVNVVPIPGAVAFVNALVVSGLSTESVFFGGFLPSKKSERRKRLDEVRNIPATLIFYETPHRLSKSLSDCLEILGERKAAIARELTKLHEEIARGNISDLMLRFGSQPIKGELVLIIEQAQAVTFFGEDASKTTLMERIGMLQSEGLSEKMALKKAAREYGLSKSEAYRLTKVKEDLTRIGGKKEK